MPIVRLQSGLVVGFQNSRHARFCTGTQSLLTTNILLLEIFSLSSAYSITYPMMIKTIARMGVERIAPLGGLQALDLTGG